MSARPHGTDEPSSGEPDEPTDDRPADEPAADDETGGAGPVPDLPPDVVDSRWSDIVSRLGAPPDPRSWVPDPEVEEAEDHFVPPEPEPVLGGDPLLTMAWFAVIGMPVLAIVVAVVWRDAPTWILQAAGVAFLAGAGLLVWRMPHERDDDDTGPGAVV